MHHMHPLVNDYYMILYNIYFGMVPAVVARGARGTRLAKWTGCIPGNLDDSRCMIGTATPLYSKQKDHISVLCIVPA